ncbi:MAG TPA: hypothetical protein VMZ00_16985 [Sporichthya sp.]|nr:hypothetical protein [Sporichthya sp.]
MTYPPSPPVRGIVAATEGMAAAVIEPTDDISRRRHRKAHRLRLSSLVLGKEA